MKLHFHSQFHRRFGEKAASIRSYFMTSVDHCSAHYYGMTSIMSNGTVNKYFNNLFKTSNQFIRVRIIFEEKKIENILNDLHYCPFTPKIHKHTHISKNHNKCTILHPFFNPYILEMFIITFFRSINVFIKTSPTTRL